MNPTSNLYQRKLRKELSQEAFSKFRLVFEEAATRENLALDPRSPSRLFAGGLSPSTFVHRFTDARKGLITFNYPCNLPPNCVIQLIKAVETTDGLVLITNHNKTISAAPKNVEYVDTLDPNDPIAIAIRERDALAIAEGRLKPKPKSC